MSRLGRHKFEGLDDALRSLHLSSEQRLAIIAQVRAQSGETAVETRDAANAPLVALARHFLKTRARGNEILGERVMSDPQLEMLLDLFIAHFDHRRVSTTDLCREANVPQTTGLRYIEKLEAKGFLTRHPDPTDHRRTWIEATDKAIDRTTELVAELRKGL